MSRHQLFKYSSVTHSKNCLCWHIFCCSNWHCSNNYIPRRQLFYPFPSPKLSTTALPIAANSVGTSFATRTIIYLSATNTKNCLLLAYSPQALLLLVYCISPLMYCTITFSLIHMWRAEDNACTLDLSELFIVWNTDCSEHSLTDPWLYPQTTIMLHINREYRRQHQTTQWDCSTAILPSKSQASKATLGSFQSRPGFNSISQPVQSLRCSYQSRKECRWTPNLSWSHWRGWQSCTDLGLNMVWCSKVSQ